MFVMLPARLWLVVVVVMVALTAVVSVVVKNFGRGQVVVIAPENSELIALVDGIQQVRVAPRAHATLGLSPGFHRVLLNTDRGASEHELTIGDGFDWLLLSSKDQCLDLLDVSNQYSSQDKPPPPPRPRVLAHLSGGERLQLSGNVYFFDKEPPTIIDARARVQMVVEVACIL